MAYMIALILLGLCAGTMSGMVGIGGGIVIVPALVYLFKFSQQTAQGTTIAMMIPPVGILAVLTYYRYGMVDLKAAALLCVGFVVGAFFGAKCATTMPLAILEKIFGGTLFLISLRMLLGK